MIAAGEAFEPDLAKRIFTILFDTNEFPATVAYYQKFFVTVGHAVYVFGQV